MGRESHVLDGLELNDGVNLALDGAEVVPAQQEFEMVGGPDVAGSVPLGEPRTDPLVMRLRLQVRGQADMDAALAKIGELVDKLEKARQYRDGIEHLWTPQDSVQPYSVFVLAGQVVELPMGLAGDALGWLQGSPALTVELLCKPFLYLPEQAGPSVTTAEPIQTLEVPGVPGDVPAEGRLVVTDTAGQARRHVEWGLENRHYDPAAPAPLLIDSDALLTTGLTGGPASWPGAYDPDATGDNVVRATLVPQAAAVCATAALPHVGAFRVKARIRVSSADVRLRLAYQVGDGPLAPASGYMEPPAVDAFCEIELGIVTIAQAPAGTQQWSGRIDALSATVGDTLDVDYLLLIPAGEGYGKARAPFIATPGTVTGFDQFTGVADGANLDGRVAPVGGSWSSPTVGAFTTQTSSAAGADLVTGDSFMSSGTSAFASLGPSQAATEVSARVARTQESNHPDGVTQMVGIYARDGANGVVTAGIAEDLRVTIDTTPAGGGKVTHTAPFAHFLGGANEGNPFYPIRLTIYESGRLIAEVLDTDATTSLAKIEVTDANLATSGLLASGTCGLCQIQTGLISDEHWWDDVSLSELAPEAFVLHTNQSIEFRHDATLRESADGTAYGQPPSYRGARFFLPPGGDADRTSRIMVKARRSDVDVASDDYITDATSVRVHYRPRFRMPRGPIA